MALLAELKSALRSMSPTAKRELSGPGQSKGNGFQARIKTAFRSHCARPDGVLHVCERGVCLTGDARLEFFRNSPEMKMRERIERTGW